MKYEETAHVYSCGFPFGELLSEGAKNPEISIGQSSISSIRRNANGEIVSIQLNGALNPGNSGGPIVSPDGIVIGVAVQAVRGAGIGFAIPNSAVTKMLEGYISEPDLLQTRKDTLNNKVDLATYVVDPFGKFVDVQAYYLPREKESSNSKALSEVPEAKLTKLSRDRYEFGLYRTKVEIPKGTSYVIVQIAWRDQKGMRQLGPVVEIQVTPAEELPQVFDPFDPNGSIIDQGLSDLTLNQKTKLPPLATVIRPPQIKQAIFSIQYLNANISKLSGSKMTVDVLARDVRRDGHPEGPVLLAHDQFFQRPDGFVFLLDGSSCGQLSTVFYASRPEQKLPVSIVLRLSGRVRNSASDERLMLFVVDQVQLLDAKGNSVAVINRTEMRTEDLKRIYEKESEDFRDRLLLDPTTIINREIEQYVYINGFSQEEIKTLPGGHKADRILLLNRARNRVQGIRFFVDPQTVNALQEQTKTKGISMLPAKVTFTISHFDSETGDAIASLSLIKLLQPNWETLLQEIKCQIFNPFADIPIYPLLGFESPRNDVKRLRERGKKAVDTKLSTAIYFRGFKRVPPFDPKKPVSYEIAIDPRSAFHMEGLRLFVPANLVELFEIRNGKTSESDSYLCSLDAKVVGYLESEKVLLARITKFQMTSRGGIGMQGNLSLGEESLSASIPVLDPNFSDSLLAKETPTPLSHPKFQTPASEPEQEIIPPDWQFKLLLVLIATLITIVGIIAIRNFGLFSRKRAVSNNE